MLTRFSWVLILNILVIFCMWDSWRFGSWWWPKTTGQVEKLDLLSHRPGTRVYNADVPCLTIYYHFRVDGNEYKDTDIPDFLQDATKILEGSKVYPPGSSVEVYYNPKNPKQSMLFPAQRLRVVLILGMLAGIALVSALGRRLRRKALEPVNEPNIHNIPIIQICLLIGMFTGVFTGLFFAMTGDGGGWHMAVVNFVPFGLVIMCCIIYQMLKHPN